MKRREIVLRKKTKEIVLFGPSVYGIIQCTHTHTSAIPLINLL